MIVFFDTEFTDLLPRDLSDPALISIGLVSQSGEQTFYAELNDSWTQQQCSSFVVEAVLPHLEGGAAVMHLEEMRSRLQSWITSFDEPVTLVSDNVVDWEWLCNLELGMKNVAGWQLFGQSWQSQVMPNTMPLLPLRNTIKIILGTTHCTMPSDCNVPGLRPGVMGGSRNG